MKTLLTFPTLMLMLLASSLVSAQTLVVDPEASTVVWRGEKVIGGGHHGEVQLSSGKLVLTDGQLSGGSFTADMRTVEVLDLTGGAADKLSGHLFSDDFFVVEAFPAATFEITEVAPRADGEVLVSGDLTIKGERHPVSFPATVEHADDTYTARGQLTIDRTKYGIRYGSDSFFDNLGDKAIADDFTLEVVLVAK